MPIPLPAPTFAATLLLAADLAVPGGATASDRHRPEPAATAAGGPGTPGDALAMGQA